MMLQLLKKGLIVYKDMTYGTSNSMNVFTLHIVDVNCNSIGENSFRPYEFIEPLLPLTKRQGTADLAEQQLLGYLGGLIDNHRTDTPREIAITCEKTETAPKTPNCLRLLWTSEEEYIQWRNLRNAASGETELERVTLLYTRVSNVYLLYLLVEFQDNTIFRKVTTFRKYGAFLKGALKELQYPEDSPTAATEAFDGILIALRQIPN